MQPLSLMKSLSSCLALLSAHNACQLHLPGPGLSAAPSTSSVLPYRAVINQLIPPIFLLFPVPLTLDAWHHLVNVAGSSLFSIYIYIRWVQAFRHIIFYVLGDDSE